MSCGIGEEMRDKGGAGVAAVRAEQRRSASTARRDASIVSSGTCKRGRPRVFPHAELRKVGGLSNYVG